MPELFVILIKINIALVLFCLGYYLVLRKLTFYTLNRVYLITAIVCSSAYPFIDLSALAQQHQEIIAPVQNVVIIWQAPAENFVRQAVYWNWLEIAFWAGAAVFALRLLFQLISLYKIYRGSTEREINGQTVRVVSGDISPFSFWRSIYINPDKLSPTDLDNVLEHEQVHVSEWHTLDVLLTEISVIFYWFNPGIWMMKRAVRENIEFITDRKILNKGLDSKAYQYSLLNITFNHPAPAITSNFNFSTLKKRILMMNAKRSSNLNLTRYAFLMPVVVVCLFIFSLSKTETVKASPAFKAVAAAVENIKHVAFNADTTPVKKTVKKTTATKKTKAGDVVIKAITTTTDNKLQNPSSAENLIKIINNSSVKVRGGDFGDSVVIVYDGKVVTGTHSIDPTTIKTVSVIKDHPNEYLNKITGSNTPADGKLKAVIVVSTTGDPNIASTITPGINNVTVVGYGSGNVAKPLVFIVDSATKRLTLRASTAGQNAPLIIVDGKEQSSLEVIDQDKIQSVTVLKDASSTSYYGEKAKYGAIIITTKQK
nr:M56 family metallopeptidase [uncultured Mucilaginibacter sp.]